MANYFCRKLLEMAKIEMLQRFLLIISKLKGFNRYISGDDLIKSVEENMKLRYGDIAGSSLRTIQRDIKSIEEIFGIIIKYKKGYGYYIAEKEFTPDRYEELLLNFDILSALNADSGLKRYIQAEHHRPINSNNLPVLIDAIRNNHIVEFDYALFRHDNAILHKTVFPYLLKESKERWYLIAMDNDRLKLFGIDRISNLKIHMNSCFERDETIDVNNLFKDCFGIWNQVNIPVEDIILSYSALDGRFIKSVPIHHSQTILLDTENEFRISLRLRITNDFIMELLSRSSSLTVIKPISLRHRIVEIYRKALQRNMDK